jgi:hypothetical protein
MTIKKGRGQIMQSFSPLYVTFWEIHYLGYRRKLVAKNSQNFKGKYRQFGNLELIIFGAFFEK